ncbi:MAG: PilZ domain-containing protein [Thermodesulfobacteriota bacterium]
MTGNDDRRNSSRQPARLPIMYARHQEHPYCFYGGFLGNTSSGGLYFESRYPLGPGDSIALHEAPDGPGKERDFLLAPCAAEVCWCQDLSGPAGPRYGIGVRFQEPAAAADWAAQILDLAPGGQKS